MSHHSKQVSSLHPFMFNHLHRDTVVPNLFLTRRNPGEDLDRNTQTRRVDNG